MFVFFFTESMLYFQQLTTNLLPSQTLKFRPEKHQQYNLTLLLGLKVSSHLFQAHALQ
jgi:hypothetical protein